MVQKLSSSQTPAISLAASLVMQRSRAGLLARDTPLPCLGEPHSWHERVDPAAGPRGRGGEGGEFGYFFGHLLFFYFFFCFLRTVRSTRVAGPEEERKKRKK